MCLWLATRRERSVSTAARTDADRLEFRNHTQHMRRFAAGCADYSGFGALSRALRTRKVQDRWRIKHDRRLSAVHQCSKCFLLFA